MVFVSTNPVAVSNPTKKSDYDTVFDNAVLLYKRIAYGRLTSDQTKNNSAAFANLPGLSFAIAANEIWSFIALLHGTSGTTPDFKFTVTAPTGAAGRFAVVGSAVPITKSSENTFGNAVAINSNGFDEGFLVYGTVVNGSTAGTIQLQFAQNTATASNSTIYTNSSIVAVNIGV